MEDYGYTIASVTKGLAAGEFSARELFNEYRDKIELRKDLNAFLSVHDFREPAAGILSGIPSAIKDNMLVKGTISTAGSKILKNYTSAYDATAIAKLTAAGALVLGKTNMDEFAMGSSTENSAYGRVQNPLDKNRVPGGSSGGSAAAVAADLCVFALGSDTGGSIRQPAAFCGIVGFKPSYGRVSRHGLIAMASSLDQIGPLTKNVRDAAMVLNAITGPDVFDSTTAPQPVPDFAKNLDKDIAGLRIGVPKEFFGEGLHEEVQEKIRAAIDMLEKQGAIISEISLPNVGASLAVYYIVMPSEVSANLARFDGIRYGHVSRAAQNLLETYMKSRSEGFGAEPKRRIMLGTYALSSGYFDAYYMKAQKVRALIRQDFDAAFNNVDVIVGPTTPSTAFMAGEKSDDPLAMYLSDVYTVPVNLAGLPAISVPCGNGSKSNLPVGLHIIGKMFDEATVLQAAACVERVLS